MYKNIRLHWFTTLCLNSCPDLRDIKTLSGILKLSNSKNIKTSSLTRNSVNKDIVFIISIM